MESYETYSLMKLRYKSRSMIFLEFYHLKIQDLFTLISECKLSKKPVSTIEQ